MNAILAFIPKTVLAGLLIAFALAAGLQTWRVGNLKAENARYEIAVDQCEATNKRNVQAIEVIKLINTQCLDGRRSDETAHANAVAAWTIEKKFLQDKQNDKAENVVEVYRDPTCEDLAKLNISNVCPGLVNGLRRRAESHNRIQDGNN
jgi:hypothetical protein